MESISSKSIIEQDNLEPTIVVLDNGIRLSYLQHPSIVAHLGVSIKAGSRYELENEQGLAHFLEHCIFKGTKNRRAFHILSRLDAVGGELNAFTTKEEICVYGSFTKNHFRRASNLMADILFNSTFPEKEVEKEKEVIIDEINSYLDNPSDKIFDDFESYLFPDNPLGNNILGTLSSVNSFHKEDLENYCNRFFQPKNIVISFVGNLPLNKVVDILNIDFKIAFDGDYSPVAYPPKSFQPFHIENAESNYQSHIMIGGMAPGFNSNERRTFALLINILGGPALNSRLGLSIREKYGYTYNIDASYNPFEDTGYWNIYASSDAKYQNKMMKLIHKELQRFLHQPLTHTALKKAKQQLKGQIALGMDSNVGTMLNFAQNLLVFNQIDSLNETYAIIDEITAEDIQTVAKTYLNEENRSTLIYSPK